MATTSSVTTGFFPTAVEGFTTTTASTTASGASSVELNSVAGYSNGEWVTMVIEPTSETKKQVFHGQINTAGLQVTGVTWTEGTNTSHAAGVTVVDYETATAWALQRKGFLVSHDEDGTLKDGAVDAAGVLASDVVTTSKILDSNVTTAKLADASVTPAKRSGGFAIGTFTKTTTGSVSVTGLSFQPKFIKLSLMISATTGSFFTAEGAADGTSQYSYGAAGTTAPGMSRWSVTTSCMNVRNVSGTSIVVATFTSFNSDGFTLNFTTADAAAGTFAYEAYA